MLHFVIALPCEARPVIAYYELTPLPNGPFRVYRGKEVYLVVSGIGKIASAAATAYLATFPGQACRQAWLNIGIAGHRVYPKGTILLAEKITDQGSGKRWVPDVSGLPFACAEVLTVDRCEKDYELPLVYEMEAAGFYSTAIRFAPGPTVQCLKIISDNLSYPPRINRRMASRLVKDSLPVIVQLVSLLDRRDSKLKHWSKQWQRRLAAGIK